MIRSGTVVLPDTPIDSICVCTICRFSTKIHYGYPSPLLFSSLPLPFPPSLPTSLPLLSQIEKEGEWKVYKDCSVLSCQPEGGMSTCLHLSQCSLPLSFLPSSFPPSHTHLPSLITPSHTHLPPSLISPSHTHLPPSLISPSHFSPTHSPSPSLISPSHTHLPSLTTPSHTHLPPPSFLPHTLTFPPSLLPHTLTFPPPSFLPHISPPHTHLPPPSFLPHTLTFPPSLLPHTLTFPPPSLLPHTHSPSPFLVAPSLTHSLYISLMMIEAISGRDHYLMAWLMKLLHVIHPVSLTARGKMFLCVWSQPLT